jgi:hypothetical protein
MFNIAISFTPISLRLKIMLGGTAYLKNEVVALYARYAGCMPLPNCFSQERSTILICWIKAHGSIPAICRPPRVMFELNASVERSDTTCRQFNR